MRGHVSGRRGRVARGCSARVGLAERTFARAQRLERRLVAEESLPRLHDERQPRVDALHATLLLLRARQTGARELEARSGAEGGGPRRARARGPSATQRRGTLPPPTRPRAQASRHLVRGRHGEAGSVDTDFRPIATWTLSPIAHVADVVSEGAARPVPRRTRASRAAARRERRAAAGTEEEEGLVRTARARSRGRGGVGWREALVLAEELEGCA